MLEDYFVFPHALIEAEEEHLFHPEDGASYIVVDVEQNWQEYDYCMDAWLPNRDSYDDACAGKFNATIVIFEGGKFLVPWTRKEWKKKFGAFIKERQISQEEQVKELTNQIKEALHESKNSTRAI